MYRYRGVQDGCTMISHVRNCRCTVAVYDDGCTNVQIPKSMYIPKVEIKSLLKEMQCKSLVDGEKWDVHIPWEKMVISKSLWKGDVKVVQLKASIKRFWRKDTTKQFRSPASHQHSAYWLTAWYNGYQFSSILSTAWASGILGGSSPTKLDEYGGCREVNWPWFPHTVGGR